MSAATFIENSSEDKERSLWCAVIKQAFDDAIGAAISTTTELEQRQARLWFTRPNRDFNEACYLAGLDPVAVRERAAQAIETAPVAPSKPHQHRSRRTGQRIITHDGVSLTVPEWSRRLGLDASALHSRLNDGWTIERAFNTPVARRRFRSKSALTDTPGVGRNFGEMPRDRRGSVAQDCA